MTVPSSRKPDAVALVPQLPAWLASPLKDYLNHPHFELILPSVPVNAELGYGHRVAVSVVQISPNPDDREVFPVGKRKVAGGEVEVFAYSKAALEKMAEAAGIQIRTERSDDRRDPEYCEIVAFAAMRGSSGQPIMRSARKAFRMSDVAEEAWRNRISRRDYAKAQGWSNGKTTDEQLKTQHDAEMASFKKHLVARVETGAILRVVRSMLAIKSGLTAEQIAKPKVLARVEFNPDSADPIAKRFMLEKGYEAGISLFGPPAGGRPMAAVDITEAEPGDEERELLMPGSGEGDPEASPAPALPQTAMPLAAAPAEQDYLSLVFEGCNALGLSADERNALMLKHKGDSKAAYLELNARAEKAS